MAADNVIGKKPQIRIEEFGRPFRRVVLEAPVNLLSPVLFSEQRIAFCRVVCSINCGKHTGSSPKLPHARNVEIPAVRISNDTTGGAEKKDVLSQSQTTPEVLTS